MNPQEPSAHRLVKPISSLPPRERGNVSSMTQSPYTCSNPLHHPPLSDGASRPIHTIQLPTTESQVPHPLDEDPPPIRG